jgi:hypothetical protein
MAPALLDECFLCSIIYLDLKTIASLTSRAMLLDIAAA